MICLTFVPKNLKNRKEHRKGLESKGPKQKQKGGQSMYASGYWQHLTTLKTSANGQSCQDKDKFMPTCKGRNAIKQEGKRHITGLQQEMNEQAEQRIHCCSWHLAAASKV